MRQFLLAACAVVLSVGLSTAQANELDNEKTVSTEQIQLGANLPKTVVIRTKAGSKVVEVLHSAKALGKDAATRELVSTSSFYKMDVKGKMSANELDQDSSSSSWYFCFPNYNYYQPSYYYGGYQYGYQSYYNYNYGGYNYSYYNWPYGGYGYGGYGGYYGRGY